MVNQKVFFSLMTMLFSFSALAGEMKIISSESNSRVIDATDPKNKKELGVTPFTIEEFDPTISKVLLVEKPGFASVYVPLPENMAENTSIEVTMQPILNWTSEELTRKTVENAENLLERVQAIQSLLDARKLKDAFPLIEALKNEYPSSFSVRLVYANALLLNGEGTKAEALYSKLLGEVPATRESLKKSIENIRSKLTRGGKN